MLCSLSGQVPVEPVASLKSGHVFEKRLLLKYLEQNQQRCPVTGDELDAATDLLALQPPSAANSSSSSASTSNGAAFSPESASIPQLLSLFQTEWDATVLETFALKQHLEKTRLELSHALYQHDAACRVIARLNDDNAALRRKLSTRASASTSDDVDMDAASLSPLTNALSAAVIATIDATQQTLATSRKAFKKAVAPARAALLSGRVAQWHVASSHTLHDAAAPGVLCVSIDSKRPTRVATGGIDKRVLVFDKATEQLDATLVGHSKRVSGVTFHPTADLLVTASHDTTLKLWRPSEKTTNKYSVAHTLAGHTDAVAALALHATGDFVLSAAADATWGMFDVQTGSLLAQRRVDNTATAGALSIASHPDGGIFATGSYATKLQIWDNKSLANVATFDGHAAAVAGLSFSENGYQLASGDANGIVHLWDLRKLKSFWTIDLRTAVEHKKDAPATIHSVSFDASGTHLAVASGANVHVLHEINKTEWAIVKTFSDHKAHVTAAHFAPDASFLATVSMDRALKIYQQ